MTKAKEATTVGVGTIEPPPITRGGRGSQVLPETVTAMVEGMQAGSFVTVYDDEGNPPKFIAKDDSDKAHNAAKQRANTAAARHKKAIVNSPDSPYDDPKAIQTRVWRLDELTYTFAIGEKPTATDEDGE